MTIGFSTLEHWAPLDQLKEIVPENPWFDSSAFDPMNTEAIWVTLDPKGAPEYLSITIGSETEEFLFQIDLTGATPVLQKEDGRVLYIRKKGGEKDVERTDQRTVGENPQAL